MIRILIVDGQVEVRRGLRMRLSIEPDMAIVGETGDVEEAISMAQALGPDVILVDIEMQGADGANVVRRLRDAAPTASTVALTLYGDESARAPVQEAGARAFLGKHGGGAGLLQTVRGSAPSKSVDSRGAVPGPLTTRRQSVDQRWNENGASASDI
ncbi:MAG: response regulator transcription factor [Anaerolineae bacterium]